MNGKDATKVAFGLVMLGMLGLFLHIPFSGWVLFAGLFCIMFQDW